MDQEFPIFKNAINEHKIILKFDRENLNEEISIILSEIYRIYLSRSIEKYSDKYIYHYILFKKNLEKENEYHLNLFLINNLFEIVHGFFLELRDKISNNENYKLLKQKFREVKNLNATLRRAFWVENQGIIINFLNEIIVVYRSIMKSSKDIDHIFHHSLEIISSNKKVQI